MFKKENNVYNILNLKAKEKILEFMNTNDFKIKFKAFVDENNLDTTVFEFRHQINYGFSNLKYCSLFFMFISYLFEEIDFDEDKQEEKQNYIKQLKQDEEAIEEIISKQKMENTNNLSYNNHR